MWQSELTGVVQWPLLLFSAKSNVPGRIFDKFLNGDEIPTIHKTLA